MGAKAIVGVFAVLAVVYWCAKRKAKHNINYIVYRNNEKKPWDR